MMVIVGCLRLSGFFVRVAHALLHRIHTPTGLLLATILLAGILSAFLVNDVVCLAVTPLLIHLARKLRFDPLPHLIGLATAANIGSAGSITGNPQNMIIGVQSHIPYFVFFAHLMPVALLGLGVDFLIISLVYRRRLDRVAPSPEPHGEERGDAINSGDSSEKNIDVIPNSRVHRWLLHKSAVVAATTVLLFFSGLPIALVALAAAAVLLIDRIKSDRFYRQVDWSLLLMFISLFIVVHAFEVQVVSQWGIERWDWLRSNPVTSLSIMSAALSNLVSNVPAVMLFKPVMHAIPPALQQKAWLALAMSSTLAGQPLTDAWAPWPI